jgi:hypothetical protein
LNISSTNLTELHKTEGRLQMAFDHSAGAFVLQSRLLVGEKTLRNIRESIRTRRSHSENTGPFHILVWRSREGQNPFRMGDLREMPRPRLARRGPTLARPAQTVAPVAAGGMADSPLPSQGVEACPLQIPPLTVPRIVVAHQKWLIGRSPKPQPFGRDPLEPKGDSSRSPASRWRL